MDESKDSIYISEKEKKMVNRILKRYNFCILDIKKVRSVYKIKTSDGNVCLKKLKHGKNKPYNGSLLVEELLNNGFYNTARYYKTNDGHSYVKFKNLLFYVTDWIDGQECNLNDIHEAIECVKLLARYHIATSKIDMSSFKIRNNLKNWNNIFIKCLHDLEKFENIIENKKLKTHFDIMYKKYIHSMYNKGIISLHFLNTSEYYRLSRKSSLSRAICHDSFYYQNIIKKNHNYYIIDLDSIVIDLHVNDLGKLIRRLMFKKNYEWDFYKALKLIEAYSSINKLNKEELEVMLSLIIFPHKFWKLGRKRYIKNKNLSEQKYTHKLIRLIKYDELQNEFLENYLKYIDNYK
ncbi:CotS family spore coat protein [Clostridium fermenticellae]|uniref:CotS family spore coat protein n=1 Tax=Clostridium fermenticellae TaxID=2068654 RepID=A0A386H3J7_9CLOT|nr:CotS family spore coat protein [Clostridium fermenticellae]AYD40301.1 CotS family spore coat protein [Clostridium fermenticellae]